MHVRRGLTTRNVLSNTFSKVHVSTCYHHFTYIYIYYLMAEKAIWLDIAQVCGRIFTTRRRVKIQHKSFRWDRGGHLPPLGFGLPPTLDMLRILFHNSSLYKSFNDTINGKLCLCEDSPRFHQIASNERSKIKISWGSMPPDPPCLSHTLQTENLMYNLGLKV